MNAVTYADDEAAVRAWARSLGALTAIVGAKGVFFGIPKNRPLPVVTLARTGGAPSGANEDEPVISFACWGRTKEEAAKVKNILKSAADSMLGGTRVTYTDIDNVTHIMRLDGANITLDLWQPDTSTNPPTARYILDIRFSVSALT